MTDEEKIEVLEGRIVALEAWVSESLCISLRYQRPAIEEMIHRMQELLDNPPQPPPGLPSAYKVSFKANLENMISQIFTRIEARDPNLGIRDR